MTKRKEWLAEYYCPECGTRYFKETIYAKTPTDIYICMFCLNVAKKEVLLIPEANLK
jgi:hypothetical protein